MKKIVYKMEKYLPVADFYAGKSVFVTGVTGFVGKVLVEKLLYSCKNVDKIYVLIRGKQNMSAQERMKDVIDKPVFTRLKHERPQDLEKITPIVGDLTLPNLGIKHEDEQSFLNKVSVVFHVAATIKYNEKLDTALDINLEGTRRVLNLCRRMERLESMVYISTAYCNTDKDVIDEVVYPPPADLDQVQKFIKQNGVDDPEKVTKILNGRANTYMFSKALAENLVADSHGEVPALIIRPTIVSPSIQEPLPGWIDNWFGATGILTFGVKGYLRVVQGRGDNIADINPVDYLSNLIVVAAAKHKRSENVRVYNSSSSECNPVTFRELFNHGRIYGVTRGFNDIPYPTLIFIQNKLGFAILSFFMQKVPAFLADSWLQVRGKRPKYMKLEAKATAMRDLQESFSTRSWEIPCGNTRRLFASLSPRDRELYPCDPAEINWAKYVRTVYLKGVRQFMLRK